MDTFQKLPPLNSDFGLKTVTVSLLNAEDAVVQTATVSFEVFFKKKETEQN
jgi:hypothetical protein